MKSNKQKQADYRRRLRDQGLVPIQVWVSQKNIKKVKAMDER